MISVTLILEKYIDFLKDSNFVHIYTGILLFI